MPHPDSFEGLIHAWLDGELSPEEAARVERLVREDPEWGAAASEARGLIAASSRVLDALDSVPGDVLPAGSRAAPGSSEGRSRGPSGGRLGGASGGRSRPPSRFSVRPWMRVAAGLVLVVGTAAVVSERVGVESAFDDVAVSEVRVDPSPIASDSIARAAAPTQAAVVRNAASTQGSTAPKTTGTPMRKSTEPADASAGQRAEAEVTAVPPSSADAFRSEEMRALVPTDLPRAGTTRSASGFGSARALSQPQVSWIPASSPVLDGCWRTVTSAAADSVLITPRILSRQGDVLTVLALAEPQPLTRLRAAEATADAAAAATAVPAAATNAVGTATVVQRGDTLVGTLIAAQGSRVPFRAVRIPCGE